MQAIETTFSAKNLSLRHALPVCIESARESGKNAVQKMEAL